MAKPQSSSRLKRFASTVLLGSVVVTAGVGSVRQLRGFEKAEFAAYDRFVQLRNAPGPDPRVLIVGISEADLQGRQEYPIHDGTIAELLTKLESYRPRAIGLDVARDIPQGPEAGRQQLTDVMSKSDRIVSACLLSSVDRPGVPPAPGATPANTGFAGFPQDRDGVVRRSSLVSAPGPPPLDIGNDHVCNDSSGETEVLSLGFLLSLMYLEHESIRPEPSELGEIQLGPTTLSPLQPDTGGYIRGDMFDYQLMLNYRAAQNALPQVSLSEVLAGEINARAVRDKVVLIGYTSQMEKDVLITPYSETEQGARAMPGVIVHGQAVSQLLSAVLDQRPLITAWHEPGELLWIWLWALAGGTLAFFCHRPLLLALLSGGAIASCWGMSWLLFQQGLWVPLVPTAWSLLITALGILLLYQARQGGYTQAIYEQLRDQIRGSRQARQSGEGKSFGYLEDLVYRAQQVRQEDVSAADNNGVIADSMLDNIAFTTDAQQELYDQIRAEVEEELHAEQVSQALAQKQQQQANTTQHIQSLLNRSKALRSPAAPSLSRSLPTATTPQTRPLTLPQASESSARPNA